jgi:phosphohistidine phosphatase
MKTKPDYWYKQSAIIPYRLNNEEIEILLITSRKKKHWIIPKGIVEKDLCPFESAKKEALEEAGISGKGNKKIIGKYKYKKWGSKCSVEVYSMEVETVYKDWLENFRERKWIKSNEIIRYIDNKKLMKIINIFFKLHQNFNKNNTNK